MIIVAYMNFLWIRIYHMAFKDKYNYEKAFGRIILCIFYNLGIACIPNIKFRGQYIYMRCEELKPKCFRTKLLLYEEL